MPRLGVLAILVVVLAKDSILALPMEAGEIGELARAIGSQKVSIAVSESDDSPLQLELAQLTQTVSAFAVKVIIGVETAPPPQSPSSGTLDSNTEIHIVGDASYALTLVKADLAQPFNFWFFLRDTLSDAQLELVAKRARNVNVNIFTFNYTKSNSMTFEEIYSIMGKDVVRRAICDVTLGLKPLRFNQCDFKNRVNHRNDLRGLELSAVTGSYYPYSYKSDGVYTGFYFDVPIT